MPVGFDAHSILALDGCHDQTQDETGGDSNGLYFLQHCPQNLPGPYPVGG